MLSSIATANKLARIVCDDTGLPTNVRRMAKRLRPLASRYPDRVINKLDELRTQITAILPTEPATITYARCVSIETFYKHHIQSHLRDIFRTSSDYRDFISSSYDPRSQLVEHLKENTLIPAEYSWLVPYNYIQTSTSDQIETLLKFDQAPPYVIMIFSVDSLRKADIKVREPRGTDTIPSKHTEWFPDNVKGERINSNIPRSALTSIEWLS